MAFAGEGGVGLKGDSLIPSFNKQLLSVCSLPSPMLVTDLADAYVTVNKIDLVPVFMKCIFWWESQTLKSKERVHLFIYFLFIGCVGYSLLCVDFL